MDWEEASHYLVAFLILTKEMANASMVMHNVLCEICVRACGMCTLNLQDFHKNSYEGLRILLKSTSGCSLMYMNRTPASCFALHVPCTVRITDYGRQRFRACPPEELFFGCALLESRRLET